MTMTPGNIEIYGLPDLGTVLAARYSAETEASADFPADNLKTEYPSDTWRSVGYGPLATSFAVYWENNTGTPIHVPVGGVGIVNHNLWPWTGKVRFIVEHTGQTAVSTFFEVIVPTAILSSTNCAPNVNDINNGFGGGGGVVSASTPAQMVFAVSMEPATNPLATGTGKQLLCVQARNTATPVSIPPSQAPSIKVEMRESGGAVIRSLGTKAVCANALPQWLLYEFDATELADVSGADLEFVITADIVTDGLNPVFADVYEVLWLSEQDGISGMATLVADSGWLPVGQYIGSPLEITKYLPQELTQGDCVAHNFYDATTHPARELSTAAFSVRALLRDDHSPDMETYNLAALSIAPPEYLEAGHMVISGAVFIPQINFTVGPLDGVRDLSTTKFTKGGGQYGSRDGTLRTAVVDFPALTQAEKAFIMDRVLRRRGISRPLLVKLTPDDPLESESLTFYATISQQETTASTQLQEDYRRRLTLNLVEYR